MKTMQRLGSGIRRRLGQGGSASRQQQAAAPGFWRDQRGGMAPFMVLALAGVMFAGAYAFDATRMTTSAAQLKRATDAAALAVGMAKLNDAKIEQGTLKEIALQYVQHNLGMDSRLLARLGQVTVVIGKNSEGAGTYQVSASFNAESDLLQGSAEEIRVSSTVEAIDRQVEVTLVLPNTGSEDAAEMAVLRRLGKQFARDLIGEGGSKSDKTWLSLVPFSQAVNVYDPSDINRIRRWAAASAIRPVELTSLFRTGIRDLGDRRMPNPKSNLLCMHRGLRLGQNYFWDQPPAGQFTRVYYRHDLPANDPTAERISWIGPNPDFGRANGVEDTRWIIADKGCPKAPVLPLTNDLQKIDARLDMMQPAFNTNYAIALGWAGMTLSPEMRGASGWGDEDLPLDFNEDTDAGNVKAIIMLTNTYWEDSGDNHPGIDTDAYNEAVVGGPVEGEGRSVARRRFESLCTSFLGRNIKFYTLGVQSGSSQNLGRWEFEQVAAGALKNICASNGGEYAFFNGQSFAAQENSLRQKLTDIAQDIKSKSSYVRLVE